MAKDSGGHGSEARGGSTAAERPGRVRGMPIAGHDYHTKTSAELHGIASDANRAAENFKNSGMTVPGSNVLTENKYRDQVNDASSVLGWRSRGGVDLSTDGLAAKSLAGGHPKSAPPVTHPAMSDGPRNAQGYRTTGTAYEGPRYNKGAVDNAIASSNRSGRHIGGREASAIHSLLKGRH
jgi:hypothetical protein